MVKYKDMDYKNPKISSLCRSSKGRDKDRLYIVVGKVNSEFSLVVDGEYRKLENPKLKRDKHLKVIFFDITDDKSNNSNFSNNLTNEQIKKYIKDYQKRDSQK